MARSARKARRKAKHKSTASASQSVPPSSTPMDTDWPAPYPLPGLDLLQQTPATQAAPTNTQSMLDTNGVAQSWEAWWMFHAPPQSEAHADSQRLSHPELEQAPHGIVTQEPPSLTADNSPGPDSPDDFEIYGDTESEADDGVYLINSGEGTWSGTLPYSEDDERIPWQAELALKHIKRAQELTTQEQRLKIANDAMEAILRARTPRSEYEDAEDQDWHKDLLLRNVFRKMKTRLQDGVKLELQRVHAESPGSVCHHPHCPSSSASGPGPVYILLCSKWKDSQDHEIYCLRCLEGLWNGEGMIGQLPDAHIESDNIPPNMKPTSTFNLDGHSDTTPSLDQSPPRPNPFDQIPESLMTSKHATRSMTLSPDLARPISCAGTPPTSQNSLQYRTPAVARTPERATSRARTPSTSQALHCKTPGISFSSQDSTTQGGEERGRSTHQCSLQSEDSGMRSPSQDSTTSRGEWRRPVTRFQHLAPYIDAGPRSSEAERAILELWKTASRGQIEWDDFRANYARTIARLTAIREDEEEDEDDQEEKFLLDETPDCEVKKPFKPRDASPEFEAVEEEMQDFVRETQLELTAGRTMKNCRGCNLSEVLAGLAEHKEVY